MAEELVKLKTKRKSIRTSVSKLLKKLESDMEAEEINIDAIEENLNILNSKSITLKELDKNIENLMDSKDVEIFEEEINTVQEYEEKIALCVFRSKKKLKLNNSESVNDSPHDHIASCKNETKQNIKLPKLTISKFFGDSSFWLDFWNQYLVTIHDNNDLSKIEKFNYLKMYLGGQALAAVSGFALTSENYDSSIELLKERFGRNDIVISSHMKKLLAVEPVKSVTNIKALRKFYDSCELQIRSLQSLNVTAGSYGNLLCPIILQKLPVELSLAYNRSRKSDSDFDITKLINFIRDEVECRETSYILSTDNNTRDSTDIQYKNKTGYSNRNYYSKGKDIPTMSALTTLIKPYCFYCKVNSHDIENCEKTNEQKRVILKSQGRCYKCLRKNHISSKCRTKIPPCELCNKTNHNKLFCKSVEPKASSQETESIVASLSVNSKNKNKGVYLQTCCVLAVNEDNNKSEIVRILIDGGSQKNFIKSDLAKQLKLKCVRKEKLYVYSFGISEGREIDYDVVQINLKNLQFPEKSLIIEALVTETITGAFVKIPNSNIRKIIESKGLQLADSAITAEIKVLLGAEHFWNVQDAGKIKLRNNLYAVETLFGYTIQGVDETFSDSRAAVMNVGIECLPDKNTSLNESLKQFWCLDSLGLIDDRCKNVEEAFIRQFQNDLQFKHGRYSTRLLWKQNHEELSDNFENAKRRLMSLDKKLKSNEWLCKNYNEIIQDQLENNIIEECDFKSEGNKTYYMPHSPVVRENVATTKVRIVYDASSKQINSLSLNDCIMSGPNLNPSILDLILRFRQYKYAFSADIEKAYHQIGIEEIDRDCLRFLYFDNDFNLKPYRMTRVPFGVSCSSFILACTIKHHINKIALEKPDVYEMLNGSVYVDDLFYGAETVEQAFKLSIEAHKILREAGMNLRKFSTNSDELKNLWDTCNLMKLENESLTSSSLKVLGLNWCTRTDVIFLNLENLCETLKNCASITKRNILKVTATIFDPVGFISPFVVRAKLLMQKLWQLGVDFDEEVPGEIKQMWSEWCKEIENLRELKINREYFHEILKNHDDLELHIFCDSSIKAYGAVAYFRCISDGTTAFVMAKSRVAPINKKLTLPRLELLGTLIASRLANYLKNLFNISEEKIIMWSDSTVALHWINGSPDRWKQFVSNRVIEIQNLTNPACWRHCDGRSNTADIITRGCSSEFLLTSRVWWSGPDWLSEQEQSWPKNILISKRNPDIDLEKKKYGENTMVLQAVTPYREHIINLENYSKLKKVSRIVAWAFRFIHNLRKNSNKRNGPLTAEELVAAELHLIKEVQHERFPEEILRLKAGQSISKSSLIYELNPFLSDEGVLRLGGRLQKSSLSFQEQHPIIIPSKHHFTDLLIRDAHEQVLHCGISNTLMFLREKFWIIRSRQNVKRVIRGCIVCQRYNSRPMQQAMAPLPASRIEQTDPFSIVGLDYAGPLFVKNDETKYYILLFTCAVTRGIHLELTKDLTTKTFLLAFRRFVSRKGLCTVIYSDNARTFKAADAELKKLWQVINHPDVKNYYANKGIQWRYIIERGAWWGGFYERLVRTVKTTLRKILGRTSLVVDELETVLIEIESVINHRPLTYVHDSDPQVLTPAHFLTGNKPTNLPPFKYSKNTNQSTKEILLKNYRYRERLLNDLWKTFFKDYLLNLKSANCVKNHQTKTDLKVNDIVIIHDEHLPRNMWRLGKVQKTFTGRDGLIRSCELKTEKGVIRRPLQLLVKLEC